MQKMLDPINEVKERSCVRGYKGVNQYCKGCSHVSISKEEVPTGIKDLIEILRGRYNPDIIVTLSCGLLDTSTKYIER